MRPVCHDIAAGSLRPATAAIREGRFGRMMLNARAVVKAASTNAARVMSGSPLLEKLSDISRSRSTGMVYPAPVSPHQIHTCGCLKTLPSVWTPKHSAVGRTLRSRMRSASSTSANRILSLPLRPKATSGAVSAVLTWVTQWCWQLDVVDTNQACSLAHRAGSAIASCAFRMSECNQVARADSGPAKARPDRRRQEEADRLRRQHVGQ